MSPLFAIKVLAGIPLPVCYAIANTWGNLAAFFNARIYRVTLENIGLCLPELSIDEQQILATKSLKETAKVLFETAHAWSKPRNWSVNRFLKITNKSLLTNALASHKTTILLAPHLGNWEILGAYLREQEKITIMYLPPKDENLHQMIVSSRQQMGIELAPANRKGVVQIFKAVKNGEFIGILPDQEPELESGEFAPFFNQPALTMTLVHKLIQRSDCEVIMAYAKRINGGFEAVFSTPEPEIYDKDCNKSLAALNRSIELCIRQVPEQYQWEYKRFKQHPSGEKKMHYRKHA